MRITRLNDNQNKFDKDIWRKGGLSSRKQIINKWNDFNNYFYINEITQLLENNQLNIPSNLQELWLNIRRKNLRRIFVTMDMHNGQPVLVKSSKVCEIHSNGDYRQAIEKIEIFPDVLIVDLDGAFDEKNTKKR